MSPLELFLAGFALGFCAAILFLHRLGYLKL